MADEVDAAAPIDNAAASAKPRRVRTGCLTCRERHLKCDEALPHCLNCRKSSRICKRGVRLNFIDTQVQDPPLIPPTQEWSVHFQDESREIAAEYRGGLGRYAALELDDASGPKLDFQYDASIPIAPTMSHQQLPPIQHLPPPDIEAYPDASQGMPNHSHDSYHQHNHSNADSTYSTMHPAPQTAYSDSDHTLTSPDETRDYLTTPDEVLYMQVFVEEVGLWMDSMDPHKHFSRMLPFHSLGEPMLLNAFLACGARHLTLVNPAYQEDKALNYYDTATRGLLKSLQNPNRDTVICATTAVILNVYEIMTERALQRMNHIAGARALIKECGWNAKSNGIGAACFWLNVGMELLSCLHFNWQVAWDPDDWGVDMDFSSRETKYGREEIWTYRILYIIGKIANFRASIPRIHELPPTAQQMRLQERLDQWNRLKDWCDSWNDSTPRSMHPMAYLHSFQTTSKSAFPEVWLIKRTTIVARLFYHTAMCLLPQMHPTIPAEDIGMKEMQLSHSHQICGIVAHVKDRGVASVALRSIAIAAECLETLREQEEVLAILEKIQKETGWRIGFLPPELKKKWGWNTFQYQQQQPPQPQMPATMMSNGQMPDFQYSQQQQQQQSSALPPAPPMQQPPPKPPSGIMNPLMRTADFNAPIHPYQKYYVAPSHNHANNHYF